MASGSSTLEIIFSAVDQTGGTINSINRGIRGLGDGVGAVTGPLDSMADSILAVDTALVDLSAYMVKEGYDSAVKYQSSLFELEKVLGDGEDDVKKYQEELSKLSSRYGIMSGEALESAADFKRAGFTIGESLELVEISMKAAAVSELDMNKASVTLVKTIRGFATDAKEADRILNILNYTSNNYSTDVTKLADGLAVIAPIAKQTGFSMEEITGAIVPIIEVMQSGTQAGHAMKTALQRLNNESPKISSALEKIGLSQRKANGDLKTGKEVYYEMIDAIKLADDATASAIVRDVIGINQAGKFILALRDKAKTFGITKGAIEDYRKEVTTTDKEVEKALSSWEMRNKRLAVAANELATAFGYEYADGMSKAVESTTKFVKSMEDVANGDNAEKLFQVLRNALAGFSREVEQLAVTLPIAFENVDLSGLIKAFEKAGGTISNIFDIDTKDPESVQAAIQKIVDTLESLVRVTDGMVQEFDNFLDYVSGAVDEFNDLDDSTKESAGNILGIGKVVNEILPMIGAFADGIGAIGSGMQALALVGGAQTIASITSALGGLSSILSSIGPAMAILGKGGLVLGGVVAIVWGFAEAFDEVRIGLLEMGEAIGMVEEGTARSEVALLQKSEMLKKSFENQRPMIQQYIKDTGDMNVTIENHHEKLQKWFKEKAKEAKVLKESNEQTETAVEVAKEAATELDKSSDATAGAAEAAEQLTESQKSVQSSLDGTIAKLGFARKEIEALAFDEKLKLVELQININNDNLNRKLDLIKADMKGLQEMFSDTGDVIVDMFDQLSKEDRYNNKRLDFIDEEKKKRQELFDLRLDMIKAAKDEVTAQKKVNMEADDYNKLIEAAVESHAKKLGVNVDDVTSKVKELVNAQSEVTGEVGKTAEALEGMSSEVYKAVFEFDIKRAEQQLKVFNTALDSVDSTIGSTENVLIGVLDSISNSESIFDKWSAQEVLNKEIKYRDKATKLQEELIEKQVKALEIQNKLAEAKADRFESGEAMISIDGSGMSPALQAVLETIIEEAHIRASDEGAEYLLGI